MYITILIITIFIVGFFIGKNKKKAIIEDLRHDMSDIYLQNQALILRVQELEAEIDRRKERILIS